MCIRDRQYDGYHFSKACADIYNPFSLFNAFNSKEYKNYWFSTGTPTFLIDILRHADFDVRALEGVEATDEQFDAPTEQITSPIPVLYQSGYLTIKGYDRNFQIYRLAYPNGEVRKGFIESLLPSCLLYTSLSAGVAAGLVARFAGRTVYDNFHAALLGFQCHVYIDGIDTGM